MNSLPIEIPVVEINSVMFSSKSTFGIYPSPWSCIALFTMSDRVSASRGMVWSGDARYENLERAFVD